MMQIIGQRKTWEETMKILESNLSVFKGQEEKKVLMRKHVLHCDHDVLSYEDFVFLAFGPLEYGVYYKIQRNDIVSTGSNSARNEIRCEMEQALKKIAAFPEFPKWNLNGRVAEIGIDFAKAILGECYAQRRWKPTGYLRALYWMRMFYAKFVDYPEKSKYRFHKKTCSAIMKSISLDEQVSFLSERFKNRVNEKCSRMGYLDLWESSSNRGFVNMGVDSEQKPTIEKHDLDKKSKVFVVRNAMSPEFVGELKREMDSASFMAYSRNNQESRRIRIASEQDTHFLVGKLTRTTIFGSTKMLPVEEKLLYTMNQMLKIYSELFEKVLDIKVRLPDQLQEVKDTLGSPGYGSHNDQSGLCCLRGDKESDENSIDSAKYMIVATYVVSSTRDKNATVIWNRVKDDESGIWTKDNDDESGRSARVQTGDNDIHFQGINCQTSYTHTVKPFGKKRFEGSGNDYRLVFSARATMHFQSTEELRERRTKMHFYGDENSPRELPEVQKHYRFINVLHGGNGDSKEIEYEVTNNSGSDQIANNSRSQKKTRKRKSEGISQSTAFDDSRKSSNQRSAKKHKTIAKESSDKPNITSIKLVSDTYGNAPHHHEDPLRPLNPVIIQDPFYKLGISKTLYGQQLQEGYYYEVLCGKNDLGTVHFGPFLVEGRAARVGELYPTTDVEKLLRISRGVKEGSLCWNPDKPNGILIRHGYKNDLRSIKEILASNIARTLWIGLTGGNPEVRGQSVVQASKATTNCESGYFPTLQKMTKQNIALLELALANATVTLFLENPENEETSYYLGCYYLNGFHTAIESIESLRETAEDCKECIRDSDRTYLRFQERLHVRVQAIPYEVDINGSQSWKKTVVQPWKKIVVHESDVFPIGVGGVNKGDATEILGLVGKNSVSFRTVLDDFRKKFFWRDLAEAGQDAIDDVTDETAGQAIEDVRDNTAGQAKLFSAGQKISICVQDFLSLMICVSVGVFLRLLRKNVEDKAVKPLRNSTKWFKRLGVVIQTYSTPHPGRVYDITPLTLISYSDSSDGGRERRSGVNWINDNPEKTKELLFTSILATTTGRMGAFYQWSGYKKVTKSQISEERKKKQIFFPKPSETEEFLDYMKKTSRNGRIGGFICDQFKKSLPDCVENLEQYSSFLRNVRDGLDNLYNKILKELKKNPKKEGLLNIMKVFLEENTNQDKNLDFVASQIIYNLDEMIDLIPDTDWNDVVFGFGSKQAMSWLMGDETDVIAFLKKVKNEIASMGEDELASLGLQRYGEREGKPRIVWVINKRALGLHDIEHFVCKVWIVMVRIIGARPSKNPRLHRPHLHPLKTEGSTVTSLYGQIVEEIAKNATTAFQNSEVCFPKALKEMNTHVQ